MMSLEHMSRLLFRQSFSLRSMTAASMRLMQSRTISNAKDDVKSQEVSEEAPTLSEEPVDPTQSKVTINGKVCRSPKEANTNLITFLEWSDMEKRKKIFNIPYFVAGSYLKVTFADPASATGRNSFTGICIARANKGLGSVFTLRNVMRGVGVEKMFELYSPALIEIQVLKLERRNKAKLYYLREKPLRYSSVRENMTPVDSGGKLLKYRRGPGEAA